MDPFIGQVSIFAGNFNPRGWALCDGQILEISQNTNLFSLIGNIYGGNGQTTMALPNLKNRTPIGAGRAPGLTYRILGKIGGLEYVTLTEREMPAHSHTINASINPASEQAPTAQNVPGVAQRKKRSGLVKSSLYGNESSPDQYVSDEAIQPSGQTQPHINRQPYIGLTFIIALAGIYPSRT